MGGESFKRGGVNKRSIFLGGGMEKSLRDKEAPSGPVQPEPRKLQGTHLFSSASTNVRPHYGQADGVFDPGWCVIWRRVVVLGGRVQHGDEWHP